MENQAKVALINEEINKELSSKEVISALIETTFKDFDTLTMKKAIMEGMLRGFKFTDFLEKNVYAIPFKDNRTGKINYSLVTSIDNARKTAMRSGLAGKSEPRYVEKDNKIESCTITVKRNVGGVIGDYTATVYFKEYDTKRNLWVSKPYTMIAKVAEMHALRSAFPEEMAKNYVEEEIEREHIQIEEVVDYTEYETKMKNAKTLDELKSAFASAPAKAKVQLKGLKDELKKALTPKKEK